MISGHVAIPYGVDLVSEVTGKAQRNDLSLLQLFLMVALVGHFAKDASRTVSAYFMSVAKIWFLGYPHRLAKIYSSQTTDRQTAGHNIMP